MNVRVVVSLDINVEAYATEYGVASGEVRADVKKLAELIVRDHFQTLGLLCNDTSA